MSDTPLIMRPDSREYKERAAAKARRRAAQTTAETPTMRDRLIDTMLANQGYAWFGRERAAKLVDAVLAEQIAFLNETKD